MIRKRNLRHNGEIEIPVEYFDHFTQGGYVADLALSSESDPAAKFSEVADAGEWLVTRTAGAGTATIVIADDMHGGYLQLTNGTADNDLLNCQLNGEAFKLTSGVKVNFQAKLRISDLTYADFFVGLSIADTSVMGTYAASGSSDHVGFGMLAGNGNLLYVCDKDNGGTTSDVDTGVDMADDTDVVLRWEYDGRGTVRFFVDGVEVGSTTDYPDDEAMTPTICLRNYGGTTAAIMEIDYFLAEEAA